MQKQLSGISLSAKYVDCKKYVDSEIFLNLMTVGWNFPKCKGSRVWNFHKCKYVYSGIFVIQRQFSLEYF